MAVLVLPAIAAKRLTVAQLEESLSAENAVHHSDAELARQIGDFELSERLTDSTLNRLAARLKLSPRTALALQLLADQSALLDPPASELPSTGAPDAAAQQHMMDAARGYVIQSLPHLPNFFATRTTNRFDDSPQVLEKGSWAVRAGLHPIGTSSRQITFRDGQEVQDSTAAAAQLKQKQEQGLSSWGEFGPELVVVLSDAAKGTITFHHWEKAATGLVAVYRYVVPRAASHYAVNFCCVQEGDNRLHQMGGGGRRGSMSASDLPAISNRPFTEIPGYHGTVSIDPATGAVLRITLETELKSGDPLLKAATVVEYGPVSIGERRYICPVRSVALSLQEPQNGSVGNASSPIASNESVDRAWASPSLRPNHEPLLLLNETLFTNYHRLAATARMLSEVSEPAPGGSALPASEVPATSVAAAAVVPETVTPVAQAVPNSQPVAEPVPVQVAPAPPAEPVIPEITMAEANALPDQPQAGQQAGFSLKVSSRLVDVGLVAYDKKGHPVKDLQASDFELYDNGHKQEIRYFSQLSGAAPVPASSPSAAVVVPDQRFSNRPAEPAPGPSALSAPETGGTILLLDESHIAWGDLVHARQEILKFLAALPPGERVGLYTITRLGFHVLTEVSSDRTVLTERLKKWMPSAQSASQAQEEETRNRQQIDEVHSVADLNSVNGNHIDVPDSDSPVDPQLLTMGSNPARASLVILAQVARHLGSIQGHKNLVWVSSDNVFADWTDQSVGIDKSPKFLDSYALHAQEAMNEAHAAVYPFDVSQLEASGVGADMQHRNVELTQAAQDTAGLGGGTPPKNNTPGRISAEMSQDLHPIQGTIRQVADATGGRVIRRAGDLAGELNGIVEDGRSTYQLGFTPQQAADGQYHSINVKFVGKQHGLTLRYRTGYLFAKEPDSLKERFKAAIWRSVDSSEIAVTASVAPMTPGANLKLEIATSDLGLQQQAGRWQDKLDIFIIQRDDAGVHAQVEGQTLGLRLKSSTYQSLMTSGVPFERFVQLKPGMASLRVLVVDENSGRMGSVTVPAAAMAVVH